LVEISDLEIGIQKLVEMCHSTSNMDFRTSGYQNSMLKTEYMHRNFYHLQQYYEDIVKCT